jgi:hypothetical protein
MPRELFSAVLCAAAILGGTVLTCLYDRRATLPWRLADGIPLGLAALGLIGLALATPLGLTTATVAVAAVAASSPVALLLSDRFRSIALSRSQPRDPHRPRLPPLLWTTFAVAVAALLWRVAQRTMFERADGIYTGVSHNIGDLPFHLTITSRFLRSDNLPPEHPAFAGVGFTYPFLTDFIGAMVVRAGMPVRGVIVWSTLLLIAVFAALMYRWTFELTANRTAARLAPIVALFSGGWGWSRLVAEAASQPGGALALIASLPHDYTITADNHYRWGNLVTSLLVTQRGLLLAGPLALIIFRLWWQAADDRESPDDRHARMVAAGVIAAMLPIVHAHTYAVTLLVAGGLAILSTGRWVWLPFFAWSLALGLPQVWWLTSIGGVDTERFLAWSFGWDRGEQNAALFWLKNTGAFMPLLVGALVWRGDTERSTHRRLVLWYLPFTLCFIIPNLLRLAPWIWDNIKVLVYWYIASVPLVALAISRLSARRRWGIPVAAALVVGLIAAGALDMWRVASGAFESRIFDRDGIAFAEAVTRQTDARALIAHAPVFNHPVGLSGRRSLMGYTGHVWSHGLDGGPREADIKRIYAGGPEADTLIAAYRIDYLVLGPHERAFMGAAAEPLSRYPLVSETGRYRLYRTSADTAK